MTSIDANAPRAAGPRWLLWLILAVVAALAWAPRSVPGLRHEHPGGGWFSRDPDGLYHARRVERALDEGAVAERDGRMNFPEGAPIPWPPYYDRVLAWSLAPFAPEGPERWRWIERAVSSAPRWFGVASALLASFAAWRMAGWVAALCAGVGVALCRGTINYSVIGTGDHHAWIALLSGLVLVLASEAARTGALESRAKGALVGVALGVLIGVMVGSWVASLLFLVIPLQLVLAVWIAVRGARALDGLAPLGLAAHSVAALVLLPAVFASPWRHEHPWMVVNLSWFHPAQLALGAAVFAPLLAPRAFAPRTLAARLYPLGVALALALLAALAWALELAPARGLAEGFAWASRADSFMDTVQESAPLVGSRAESGVLFLALGYGVLALPVALVWLARSAFAQRRLELVVWIVSGAWLLGWALVQRRFADPLAVPMAVALGLGAAQLARFKPRVSAPLVCLAVALAHWPSASSAWRGLTRPTATAEQRAFDAVAGERLALEWIRGVERTDASGGERWSVLSHWDRGHGIEFVADAASVATNFGSYIGIESYRDPPRFFLSQSPDEALALLERRAVRFVLAPASLVGVLRSQIRVAGPELGAQLLDGAAPSERYWATMAGRLLSGGAALGSGQRWLDPSRSSLAQLALVHVSRERNAQVVDPRSRQALPAAFVWERVPGAKLQWRGASGARLEVQLALDFREAGYGIQWRAEALADAQGLARVVCPYPTEAGLGQGVVRDATWSCGAERGALRIPLSAVRAGASVQLER